MRLHSPIKASHARRPTRVDISIDEGLLFRIDEVAKRMGLSRSSRLARGARTVIASETASP